MLRGWDWDTGGGSIFDKNGKDKKKDVLKFNYKLNLIETELIAAIQQSMWPTGDEEVTFIEESEIQAQNHQHEVLRGWLLSHWVVQIKRPDVDTVSIVDPSFGSRVLNGHTGHEEWLLATGSTLSGGFFARVEVVPGLLGGFKFRYGGIKDLDKQQLWPSN